MAQQKKKGQKEEKGNQKSVFLQVRIHPELKRMFKEHCDKNFEDMSGVLISYIKQHIGMEKR